MHVKMWRMSAALSPATQAKPQASEALIRLYLELRKVEINLTKDSVGTVGQDELTLKVDDLLNSIR